LLEPIEQTLHPARTAAGCVGVANLFYQKNKGDVNMNGQIICIFSKINKKEGYDKNIRTRVENKG
jgi:hypothetical protein